MSDLEFIIRKFVRLPWEVCDGAQNYKDKEIADSVAYSCHAGTVFREPPVDARELELVLHTCARVLIIAFLTQRSKSLVERNKFKTLTDEEKQFLFRSLYIDPLQHDSVLEVQRTQSTCARLASYVAAAYALTTYTKVFVADFEFLLGVSYQAMREPSPDEKSIRSAGLFLLTELGSPTHGYETTLGFLRHMLAMRATEGKMNMFFDIPHGKILQVLNAGKVPRRSELIDYYNEAYPPQFRLDAFLVGGNVHIPLVDAYGRSR